MLARLCLTDARVRIGDQANNDIATNNLYEMLHMNNSPLLKTMNSTMIEVVTVWIESSICY
jgi:hypothetical protein